MNRLRYIGGVTNEDLLCAALLHDTLEETDLQPEVIFKELGANVLDLVIEVTREEPELPESLSPEEVWHLRSQKLLEEISCMSPAAQTLKLADRASNLTSAWKVRSEDALARYLKQTEWILKRIPKQVNPALWEDVDRLRQPRG